MMNNQYPISNGNATALKGQHNLAQWQRLGMGNKE